MQDRTSWTVKDNAILDDLVALMGLTDEEKAIMTTVQPQAEAMANEMVDAFYVRLVNHENTFEYLDGMVDHLRVTLKKWFVQLFSGDYGTEYVQSRLAIGKTHVRIGLPVRYPLAMMDVLLAYGEKVTAQSTNPELATGAFRKLVALDIAIFNQAYENTQLNHLSEMVGNERLARRLLTQKAA